MGPADRVDEHSVVDRAQQADLLLAEDVEAARAVTREGSKPDARAVVERVVQGREQRIASDDEPFRQASAMEADEPETDRPADRIASTVPGRVAPGRSGATRVVGSAAATASRAAATVGSATLTCLLRLAAEAGSRKRFA